MFLDRDDTAGLDGGFDDGLGVDGLESVHIDDLSGDALFFEHHTGDERVTGGHAAGDDGDIVAVFEFHRLADFEGVFFLTLVEQGFHTSADAEIEGAGDIDAGFDCACGFPRVRGDNDGHVGDGAHNGEVLDAVVGGARRAEGDAAVGGYDLDGQLLISAVRPDLLAAAEASEDGEGGGEGDKADFGKTCCHAEEVLFGDTDIEESVGEGFAEQTDVGGFRKVGGHTDDTGVFCGEFGEGFAVHCAGRHFIRVVNIPCSSHRVPP